MLLGKGNMGEWAFSPTFSLSSVAGAVRNPYDLDRTPAGSSGGPAAGVSPASLILSISICTGSAHLQMLLKHSFNPSTRALIWCASYQAILKMKIVHSCGG